MATPTPASNSFAAMPPTTASYAANNPFSVNSAPSTGQTPAPTSTASQASQPAPPLEEAIKQLEAKQAAQTTQATTSPTNEQNGEVSLRSVDGEDPVGAEDTIYIDRDGNFKSTVDQPTK
jgi:hypothetical protein